MNFTELTKIAMKKHIYYFTLAIFILLSACIDEPGPIIYEDDEMTIARSLEDKQEYSELLAALKRTQYFNILALQGSFTLLVADNDAFTAYYDKIGVSGLNQLSDEEVKNLVETHIFTRTILSIDFKAGRMPPSANKATLVMSFTDEGIKSAKINGIGISEFDLLRTNGVMYKVNEVISPPDKTIAEKIAESPEYSILYEALVATGVIDSINVKSEASRNRYTVFVESNEALANEGINSYEDLKNKYSDTDDITQPEDKFNQYIRYHIVDGDYTIVEFQSNLYLTLLNYPVKIDVSNELKINLSVDESGVETYATINIDNIDFSLWNGFLHEIESTIPVIEVYPQSVLFVGTSLALSKEELDMSKVIYAGDAEPPWIAGDKEVLQYLCTEVGSYIEFYSPYMFDVSYKVYYEPSTWAPGKTVLGVYINDEMIGEPFVNVYEKIDLANGKTGYYLGKVTFNKAGSHRIKVKVEGSYLYPEDNYIRLKKIYFEPVI